MAPRFIESDFSKHLQKQIQGCYPLDLRVEGPLLGPTHPKIVWAKLSLEANPEQELPTISVPGWSYQCFDTLGAAQISHPAVKLCFEGRPWTVAKFIHSTHTEALVDFKELGTVYLFRGIRSFPVECGQQQYLLSLWLSYALSTELWGPMGKWTRFHDRLHALLHRRNLIAGEDAPGYYPLKQGSAILEGAGFLGTRLDKTYLLVLPWTFPLTALQRLEEVISQEFPCLS